MWRRLRPDGMPDTPSKMLRGWLLSRFAHSLCPRTVRFSLRLGPSHVSCSRSESRCGMLCRVLREVGAYRGDEPLWRGIRALRWARLTIFQVVHTCRQSYGGSRHISRHDGRHPARRWARVRWQILNTANWRCAECGWYGKELEAYSAAPTGETYRWDAAPSGPETEA